MRGRSLRCVRSRHERAVTTFTTATIWHDAAMHPHAALITSFYEAFAAHDAEAMCRLYHPNATFTDPVFVGLDAVHVRGMWRMLTSQASDLRVVASRIEANDSSGTAHWDAH